MASASEAVEASGPEVIGAAIEHTLAQLRTSLQREGADIDVRIDRPSSTVIVSLIRNRIICEGCIQPEKLVRTMLSNAMRADPAASALKYKIDTRNWAL